MSSRAASSAKHNGALVSVGYEGRDLIGFVATLNEAGVEVLVDVRLTPISRKKGFSKTALSAALEANGIVYRHAKELGNPKDNRAAFSTSAVETGRRRYLEHLNNGSRVTYDEIVGLAQRTRVALLCVENDDRQCHRGCIIDQAKREDPDLLVVRL